MTKPKTENKSKKIGKVRRKRMEKQEEIKRIISRYKALGVFALLYQGLVVAHEFVHQAIFSLYNIPSRLEIGLFWGQVIPDHVPPDITLRASMQLAHSINECVLPIGILLIIIIAILLMKN